MLKVSPFKKSQEFAAPKAKFFVSPTGSRHLGEMKTSIND